MTETDVIVAQLQGIAENIQRLERKIDSIECKFDGVEARLREVEKVDAQTAAINQGKIDAAHRRLDDHEKRMDGQDAKVMDMEKAMQNITGKIASLEARVTMAAGLLSGVGLLLFGAVIGLLFEVIKRGGLP